MPRGRNENGPYHSLTDWARPHNMYGKGGEVAPYGALHTTRLLLHVAPRAEILSQRVDAVLQVAQQVLGGFDADRQT
jgi:hypothetical protein